MSINKLLAFSVFYIAAQAAEAGHKGAWAEHVPGQFVVKAKDASLMSLQAAEMGFKVKQQVNASEKVLLIERRKDVGVKMLTLDDGAIRRALLKSGNFAYVEPNYIYRTAEHRRHGRVQISDAVRAVRPLGVSGVFPNDPQFSELWGLLNFGQKDTRGVVGRLGADIDAVQAWTHGTGSKDLVVAVIDTGIDYNHPDLVDNIWSAPHPDPSVGGRIHGYNAINNSFDPMDDNEHGTHCAGTIGGVGNNGIGVTGVNWNVTLMGVKFLSGSGSGTLADAIKAIDWATSQEVDVMSNSWGGGGFSQALKDAIQRANDKGIVFVAAAGNSSSDNDSEPSYPATYDVPNVISVAATTNLDQLASFSSYGKKTVHVAAPGHNIVSTTPRNTYSSFSGTSMATPHVAGAVALFKSQRGRNFDPAQVRQEIMKTSERAVSFKKKVAFGGSRLNLNNLMVGTVVPGPVVIGDGQWSSLVPHVWESEHPYQNNFKAEFQVNVPGATHMRLHFSSFDLENRYDNIYVVDAVSGEVLDRLSGNKGAFVTEQIDSGNVILRFETDGSDQRQGFVLDGYSSAKVSGLL